MSRLLLETLKTASIDVAVAEREGKLENISRLPSIEALKKALGADESFNIVCNGSCADSIEGIEEKFVNVDKADFNFERLQPILNDDISFNVVCNGSCFEDPINQLKEKVAKK